MANFSQTAHALISLAGGCFVTLLLYYAWCGVKEGFAWIWWRLKLLLIDEEIL